MKRYKCKYSDDTVTSINISESLDAVKNFIEANGHKIEDIIGGDTKLHLHWIWRNKLSTNIYDQELIGAARPILTFDGNEYHAYPANVFNQTYGEVNEKGEFKKKVIKKKKGDHRYFKVVNGEFVEMEHRADPRKKIVDLIAKDTWSMDKEAPEPRNPFIKEPKRYYTNP